MECMRALIEKDPQSEGYFTNWSPSLERIALRKSRYLSGPEPALSPAAPASTAVQAVPVTSGPPTIPPAPPLPGRSATHAQPEPKPAPANGSLFGSKLLQALNDERN